MEIHFASEKLRKLCESRAKLVKKHGPDQAKKINARLRDAEAAACLEDCRSLPGKWHELTGDLAGSISVSVGGGLRLLFTPTDDPPPVKPDGGLDWDSVTAVTVTDLTDYH